MEDTCRISPKPKRRSTLDMIWAPETGYFRADQPRGSAFSRLQRDPKKKKGVKEEKNDYLTPLNASTGNVFLKIEDKRMLPRPPRKKTPLNKWDVSKYCQYHNDRGHDTNDCRHLKIEIEKLIQLGQVKDITKRVNVISGGRSGGGDSGSTRRAYAKRDIYAVTASARPEFPDLSFSRKYFEGI
ncbi:hypothetical protein LIER_40930 [Lithospermum erythrorhizon]|uniref:Reverse transcriptase domain-containing protein n=1 Tax=Lithospermum erythrorhizon TaxID=34254 RepID=A0AAV3R373_LITER